MAIHCIPPITALATVPRTPTTPLIHRISNALIDLSIVVAMAVACLGWSLARLLDFPPSHYLPVWFAGTLCIYTLNRATSDPADAINAPHRHTVSNAIKFLQQALLWGASVFLLIWPIHQRDWLLLAGIVLAATTGIGYIHPLPGTKKRLKHLPIGKTFVPTVVVTGCLLGYPALREGFPTGLLSLSAVGIWLFSLLLFNITLCDQRDLSGDFSSGVITLPAWLGPRPTHWVLIALIVLHGLSAMALGRGLASTHETIWITLSILMPCYLLITLRYAPRCSSPYQFEWLVEGMLVLPAMVVLCFFWL